MKRLTTEEFIKKAKEVHGDKYNYSKTVYIKNREKIKIICPIHGEFEQSPKNHLNGFNCPFCGNISRSISQKTNKEEFIKKAKNIFPNYDYSLVDYKNEHSKIKVICPEHGVFYKILNDLLNGFGCPECSRNRYKGEEKIKDFLQKNNILFERNKKFAGLGKKSYDFYLQKENLLIEYNGKQHYKFTPRFQKTEQDFHKQKHNDWLKRKFARDNGYKLLTIPYWEFKNIDTILEDTIYKK